MYIDDRLAGFEVYVGQQVPSVGNIPSDQDDTQLCYTHQDPILEGGLTYRIICDVRGSDVSIMCPSTFLTLCEVQVYGKYILFNMLKN